jgi:hypothetical protein
MSIAAAKTSPKRNTSALSEKSVAEIRSLHSRGGAGWTPKSLARIFSTTETAIAAVVGRTGAYKD